MSGMILGRLQKPQDELPKKSKFGQKKLVNEPPKLNRAIKKENSKESDSFDNDEPVEEKAKSEKAPRKMLTSKEKSSLKQREMRLNVYQAVKSSSEERKECLKEPGCHPKREFIPAV